MPATPALPPKKGPPKSTPRLFVDEVLSEGGEIRIEGGQAHYLLHVRLLWPWWPQQAGSSPVYLRFPEC